MGLIMFVKNDIKGMTFKKYDKTVYGIVICDYCNNLAIGTYIDENDKDMLRAIDVCEKCYKKSIE